MRKTTNRIIQTFLAIFFSISLMLCQTIKEDGKSVKLDPDTEKKISILVDSLTGTWQLVKTIRYENGDTIVQEPSLQLWLTPGAKPATIIKIDAFKNFEIKQVCMKCPYLFWKGKYEVEIRTFRGLGFFYLNFVDNRQKKYRNKKEISLTSEFNGFLTNFENGEFTLTDKEGREWIYKRTDN